MSSSFIGELVCSIMEGRVERKETKSIIDELTNFEFMKDEYKKWLKNKENAELISKMLKFWIRHMILGKRAPYGVPDENTYTAIECFHILGGNYPTFFSGNTVLHILAMDFESNKPKKPDETEDDKFYDIAVFCGFDNNLKNEEGFTPEDILKSKGYNTHTCDSCKGFIDLESSSSQSGDSESSPSQCSADKTSSSQGGADESSSQAVSDSPNEDIVCYSDGTIAEKILPIDMVVGSTYIFFIDREKYERILTEIRCGKLIFECGYVTTDITKKLFYKSR